MTGNGTGGEQPARRELPVVQLRAGDVGLVRRSAASRRRSVTVQRRRPRSAAARHVVRGAGAAGAGRVGGGSGEMLRLLGPVAVLCA